MMRQVCHSVKPRVAFLAAAIALVFTASLPLASPANAMIAPLKVEGYACAGGGIYASSNQGSVIYYTPQQSGYAIYADETNYFHFKIEYYDTAAGTGLDLTIKCDNGVWYYLDTIHISGPYTGVYELGWV